MSVAEPVTSRNEAPRELRPGSDRASGRGTPSQAIHWPDSKPFAFSVFDDSDNATVSNVAPVYDLLRDLGFRTTKSVWALGPLGNRRNGQTCEDPDYLAWTLELQAAGFEIGSHGASPTTSDRLRVIRSMDRFRELYGADPAVLANHTGCLEAIYWGADRVTGINRLGYNLLTRFRRNDVFRGHREGDPLFWGDICQARVRYVRNFTFSETDTLAACPIMPYHDPERPYVNYWFASSEGSNVNAFNARIAPDQLDRLEASGGACIMYTHFASGFSDAGRINPEFRRRIEDLVSRGGWFVPVTTLLDYIRSQRGDHVITSDERRRLERQWLLGKVRTGTT